MIFEQNFIKYTFSGHDSFQCRQLWLKKGYDFIKEGLSYNNEDAVIRLGVGKNMVSSIRFWMKAFNIVDSNEQITKFGEKLFDTTQGYDPFLEDEGTLWLLHYQLIKTGVASIYNIIFNELRKEKVLFNNETFINYIKRKKETEPNLSFNPKTLSDDFLVFTKMYQRREDLNDVEESFSGVLSEIELLQNSGKGREEQFYIENNERNGLPNSILLFSILDNLDYGSSISLNSLEFSRNSPGTIFAINRSGLVSKIKEIVTVNKYITFTDHAGIKDLQFKKKPDPYSILDRYYAK
jgi:hypothetical protein